MVELQDVYNEDVAAALAFLKKQPYVDPVRIVMSGVSYGGIQTLLSAQKGLGVRAFVAFAPGAMSWERNAELRDRLVQAVQGAKAPLFLLQATNDYNLGPSRILGPEVDKLPVAHRHKIYPDYGQGHDDGHYGFATKGASVWGPDVFAFIDETFSPAKR
jgi:dienelactone hydrolase